MGIGIWELIMLVAIFFITWLTFKVSRHSFRFLNKTKEGWLGSPSNEDNQADFDISDIRFVFDNLLSEKEVIATEEEIPLDNRHGSSPLVSEHEFSRTVTNSFKLDRTTLIEGKVKTSLWTLIETEVQKNLAKSIGVEFGEQITRRVTVKLEAAPGQLVRYRLVWKQKQREGSALINIEKKQLQIPYSTTHGLFHAVESIQV